MSSSHTYGVIDLASAVDFRSPVVALSPPKGCSLLDEETYFDTLAVGPWLIDLDLCPDIGAVWRKEVRDRSCGYTVFTDLALADLRRHLRKFALAELEDAPKPVFFRYFDARVIRTFLTGGFTDAQRAQFLAPFDGLEVAAADGTGTQYFEPDAAPVSAVAQGG
ncbi:DUF4123 domain-containing protein [Tateyamaria sp. ANG-S1]|uniref:DUF4123 domain-containing protein n=1 Tax=Tateyamaria sp. ANG-S1 TaxID=1577905 RepID=UPI00057DCD32|nr:DUF4123 domain-containing protein [Tateyamaria sp. ANG-S1]KIC47752.1 hypothetical protein RA29_19255 [Tateyamaria sp. ANG-S1]